MKKKKPTRAAVDAALGDLTALVKTTIGAKTTKPTTRPRTKKRAKL